MAVWTTVPRVRSRLLVVVALALSVAACGGNGHDVQAKELPRLVLQPADLPGFTRFDVGPLVFGDARPGPRRDPERFGRERGWKARFKRSGSASTPGPLVVESRVDVFEGEAGARRDLDAYRAEFGRTAGARAVAPPQVGERAVAMTLRQALGRVSVRFFTIAWRDGNATASVTVSGFERKLRLRQALGLARKQERRIARTLG